MIKIVCGHPARVSTASETGDSDWIRNRQEKEINHSMSDLIPAAATPPGKRITAASLDCIVPRSQDEEEVDSH